MQRLREIVPRRRPLTAPPEASVHAVSVMMNKGRVGAISIVDGDRLVGIFSERDLMTRVVVPRLDVEAMRVGEVMTREVVTASLDDPVAKCVERMQRTRCRHLPVVEEGRVIGMVSMRDLLRQELAEQGDEIRHLKAYIHQTPV